MPKKLEPVSPSRRFMGNDRRGYSSENSTYSLNYGFWNLTYDSP